MTEREQSEIDHLVDDAAKLRAETLKLNAEADLLRAEALKLSAEQAKLHAESLKSGRESAWYPFVAGSAFAGAVSARTALSIKLIHGG